MIGLLGKKLGMTQIFDDQGRQVSVTVLEVGPCYVTGVRNMEKNGYLAVQLAFGAAKEARLGKARMGHLKKASAPALRHVREIRTEEVEGLQIGQKVGASNFEAGDFVDIEGTSIGKGFQGVVKRHHFKGALTMSHGDMSGRRPGSIGASSFPSRVVKGMRGPGHMGNEIVTTQNLKVVKVDSSNNLLLIKGAVPGKEGAFVVVRTSLKRGTRRKWKIEGAQAAKEKPSQEAKPEVSEEKA